MSDKFDLRVISLGLGRQSVAMYLLADEGKLGHIDYAVFADTQDESPATYRWIDLLLERGGIPIVSSSRGRLSDEVLRSMRETPSGFCPIPTYVQGDTGREKQGRRQCTRSHKTDVIYRTVRALLSLEPGERSEPNRCETLIGISTDEAHRASPSRYPLMVNRFPLLYDIPMRRWECAQYVEEKMGEVPPKSSCTYCPFRSDADWIDMKQNDRASFDRAVSFERKIHALDPQQFIHDSCKPLDEVNFEPDRTLDLFGNDCTGLCGV